MKLSNIAALLALILSLLSCNNEERISREVFEDVKKGMAVKRVSDVQIVEKALAMGNEISMEAQEQLMQTLQNAIQEKGMVGAVEFCNVEALPLTQSVGMANDVDIRRVSNNNRNPDNSPNEDEETLLDAYEYNNENNIKSDANIQKLQNGEVLLYTRAITISNQLCLNCHGDPNVDIDPQVKQRIDELYPQDNAKGYTIGDLRGMWSIKIPRKEVIRRL